MLASGTRSPPRCGRSTRTRCRNCSRCPSSAGSSRISPGSRARWGGGRPLPGAGWILGGGGEGGGGGGGVVLLKTEARRGGAPAPGGGGKPPSGGRDLPALPVGGGLEPYLAWLASEVGGGA